MTEQLSQCLVLIIYICVNITIIINLYVEYYGGGLEEPLNRKLSKILSIVLKGNLLQCFREGFKKKIWIFPDLV